jgi:hypothetical protein
VHKSRDVRRILSELDEAQNWYTTQMPDLLAEKGLPNTERQIQAHVQLQPKVVKLRGQLEEARYEEDLVRMMCDVFEHRKMVLNKL